MVVTSIGSPTVSVLFGDGTGNVFNRRIDLPIVGNHHPSVVTADFDGDGALDIAISNVSGGNSGDLGVSVFGGDGKGGFSKRVDFRTGTSSVYSLSIADLNGDRRPDLVFGSNTLIGVLPNTTSSHRTWIDAVQNAASSNVGPISPGEIITLYGKGIGPERLVGIQLDSAGLVSKATAGTQVLFDGVPAPIVYTWATQVSAIVPYAPRFQQFSTSGGSVVEMVYQGEKSNPLLLSTTDAAPGIFTLDSTGGGQGAILNQDLTVNSPSNPALRGSVVSIFVTGEGQTTPQGIDGKLAVAPLPKPSLPVLVSISGISTEVLYAGAAPGLVAGVMQINARVPAAAATGNAVPISFTVGSTVGQSGVTLAVR